MAPNYDTQWTAMLCAPSHLMCSGMLESFRSASEFFPPENFELMISKPFFCFNHTQRFTTLYFWVLGHAQGLYGVLGIKPW